jgi:hypothetical protein
MTSAIPPIVSRDDWLAARITGYRRLEQLTALSEAEVQQLHGVGPKALVQLRHALGTNGLSFAEGTGRRDEIADSPTPPP